MCSTWHGIHHQSRRPFDLDFDPSDDDDDDDDSDSEEEEEDITDQIGREIASQIFLNYGDVFEDGKEGGGGGEGITEIPLGDINFTSSGKGGTGESLDETIPPAMRKRIEEAVSAGRVSRASVGLVVLSRPESGACVL